MIKKIITVTITCIILAGFTGWFWLSSQFDEDSADYIDSLTRTLKVNSVMFVGAHPDDEQLATGLLVEAQEQGLTANMLTATRGERGGQYPQVARKVDQAVVRMAETLQNSFALGVEKHDVLQFPDGLLPTVPFADLVVAVKKRMIRWQPELVATFWPGSGFSKHNDHMLMGKATTVAAMELQAAPVDGYSGPEYLTYLLAPSKAMALLGGERGKWVAEHQPPAQYTIDGQGWAKLRGWDIHRSQAEFVQADYGLPPWFVHRVWNTEHYYSIKASQLAIDSYLQHVLAKRG